MMAIRHVEAREVEVCDFCGRENQYLKVCWVCGRQFCLTDEGMVCGSYGFLSVCRECSHREDVNETCRKFSERLAPIFVERDKAVKKLSKKRKAKKVSAERLP